MRMRSPIARARLRWLSPEEGGRPSPPQGPLYASTAVFAGDDAAEHYSIVLDLGEPGSEVVDVDFLARDLVRELVRAGARFAVMEGRRAVAEGEITELLTH